MKFPLDQTGAPSAERANANRAAVTVDYPRGPLSLIEQRTNLDNGVDRPGLSLRLFHASVIGGRT